MKIAIIAPSNVGGGRVRAVAYKDFLQSKNYCVDMLSFDEIWQSKIGFFYQRAIRHLFPHELRMVEKTANILARAQALRLCGFPMGNK